jgi:predicted acetyltransferase
VGENPNRSCCLQRPLGQNGLMTTAILKPSQAELPGFVAALKQGWSPDNVRGAAAAEAALAAIERNPDSFMSRLDDCEARGDPMALPDGSFVPRLPSYTRWIWDGAFCGSIGFRRKPGTSELPPYTLGHIGFAVVPWKRGQGHAKRALGILLPDARAQGLPHVDLTTTAENHASQRVIVANGGVLVERFIKDIAYGGGEALRFRITL